MHQLRLFFIALQFFTRLPVPRWVGFEPAWLQQAARYFPAVGILVGVVTAAVYMAASWWWPPAVAALLSTACGIWLTGAFHEDGFADMCDGFGGSVSAARVLEIMKDSRIGAYGAIGIGMLLALKCALLATTTPVIAVAALVAAHPLSRLLAITLVWRLPYARENGKAKPMATRMSHHEYAIAAASAAAPLAALGWFGVLPWQALLAGTLLAVAAAWWLARMFMRRIGGYTGDCLGAVQQMAEVCFYLGLLALPGY